MKKELFKAFTSSKGLQFKNRIIMAPMTNEQSHEDGTLGEDEFQWLKRRAEGGFAAMVTACAHVIKEAKAYPGELGAFSDAHIEGLSRIADLWKANQGHAFLQLFHGGYRSPKSLTGVQPVAPSAVELNFPGFEVPRALTEDEIQGLIVSFKEAALRAVKAGLPGVEIHGANGYLFTQFLSTKTNLRTDQWGGSNANRARFLIQTVKEIRASVPKSFIVGVRLLAEDSAPQRGFDIDETSEVAAWLKEAGADYLHIGLGMNALSKPWKYPEANETSLSRIRNAVGNDLLLIACGGINSVESAQNVLNEGADLVALARTAIAAPEWPLRAQDPKFSFKPLPLTADELKALSVQEPFINYLRSMKMVVA